MMSVDSPRKPSAVERLEADKAKYVKSHQVALNKQLPVIRKPLLAASNSTQLRPGALRPTRKVPTRSPGKCEAPLLDLKHLSNLIIGDSDTTARSTPLQLDSPRKTEKSAYSSPPQPLSPTTDLVNQSSVKSVSSPPPQMKSLAHSPATNVSCTATVRRVDVRPQVPQVRKPVRAQLQNRAALQLPDQRIHSQLLQLLRPYSQPQLQPLKPVGIRSRQDITSISPDPTSVKSPKSPVQTSPLSAEPLKSPAPPLSSPVRSPKDANTDVPPLTSPAVPLLASASKVPPPSSPAMTRQSSVSSRKRPSLTRSKSDVSDRFSRVERFFNYCGLDPSDFEELEPGSDIASVSRLRSASAPASERTAEGEEEEEEATKDEKPTYGISVIERNARVIKWLYGMGQAKDSVKVANI